MNVKGTALSPTFGLQEVYCYLEKIYVDEIGGDVCHRLSSVRMNMMKIFTFKWS